MWQFNSRSERQWRATLQAERIPVTLLARREGGLVWDYARAFWRYRRLIRTARPDIVNSHFERGNLCAVLLRLTSLRVPILVRTQHAPEQWQTRPWLGTALNLIFR